VAAVQIEIENVPADGPGILDRIITLPRYPIGIFGTNAAGVQ